MPLPSTIKALWGGNSDGQTLDQSIYGNNLTLVGTVPNPSSPTPYEGDRWLGQGLLGGTDYFTAPLTTITSTNFGKFSVAYRHAVPGTARQSIVDIRQGANVRYLILEYTTASGGVLDLLYTTSAGAAIEITYNVGLVVGQTYIIDIISQAGETDLRLNGTIGGTNPTQVDLGVPTSFNIGCRQDLSQGNSGYIDLMMLSTNPNEPYPPSLNDNRSRRGHS